MTWAADDKSILAAVQIDWLHAVELRADTLPAGDDKGELTHALGIVLDATGGLGNLRSKRSVIVIEDGKVVSIKVEPDSGKCE